MPAASLPSTIAAAPTAASRDPLADVGDLLRAGTPDAIREAVRVAQRLVEQHPATPRFRLALAGALRTAGRRDDAVAALEAAAALNVAAPEISFNLAVMLAELDRGDEAIAWFRDALRQRPQYIAALNNLGELLHGQHRLAEAEQAYARALSIDPASRVARFNLGLLCRETGRWTEAGRAFRELLAGDPASRPAWVALAATQSAMGQTDAAAQSLSRAIALDPAHSASELTALGAVLAESGEVQPARDAFRRSLQQDPANVAAALGLHLTLPQVYASAAAVGEERRRFGVGLDALAASFAQAPPGVPPERAIARVQWTNFYLAYQGEDDLRLQTRYGDWLGGYLDSADPSLRAPMPRRPARDRIRVGFASRFFNSSTVGAYFGRWQGGLDRGRFEVRLFDLARHADATAAAAAPGAADALPLGGRSLRGMAGAIRDAELDVLVYPELGMHDVAFTLAGMRLAPVQCCAWGHPVTSGHPTIDYFLTTAAMEPAGAGACYRERLVGLPGIGTSYPRPPAVAKASRAELGLAAGRTLFLCPQSLFKIHPDNDALLADVLCEVPDATLVLFAAAHPLVTEAFMRRLSPALEARGMRADQCCRVLPLVPRETYLALTAACDVVLDTLRWSGGNTSLDAFACGLPLVTLPGDLMRGRQSMAMLHRMGLPQLVARDRGDYVRIAVDLGRNPGLRADLSREIAAGFERLVDDDAPLRVLAGFLEAAAGGGDVARWVLT